jgi:reactive intermediate/imine deaminase
MAAKDIVSADAAPRAIGPYSQAVRAGGFVFLSGQIGLDPATMALEVGIDKQIHRVFSNLKAVAEAAGLDLDDAVKLTIFLADLRHFPKVNEIMAQYFREPYPARATVGVAALPREALVEVEAVLLARK